MPAVAAPADKRFRRAHVKPGRKRAAPLRAVWTITRGVIVFGLMTYGGWRGTTLVLGAPALQISRVVVRGNERLATGEVLALVQELRGRNILTISLDDAHARLLSSPWIAEATLRRTLPRTVEIDIRERQPMGIGRVANGLYLVDPTGVIVDEYGPNYADLDLPIVDGLATAPHKGAPIVDEVAGEPCRSRDRRARGAAGSERQDLADRRVRQPRRGGDPRGRHRHAAAG